MTRHPSIAAARCAMCGDVIGPTAACEWESCEPGWAGVYVHTACAIELRAAIQRESDTAWDMEREDLPQERVS